MDIPNFHQIAYVVRDLDTAVKTWSQQLGVGPWRVWEMKTPRLKDMYYRGETVEFSFRHALAMSGSIQFELVQPLTGPSIFQEQLDLIGEGPNHVGMVIEDHSKACADFENRGFTRLQSGRFGASEDGLFAYFQHPNISVIIELIHPPSERFLPEYTYPGESNV